MKADIVKDMAGRDVDCSTQIWRLNTPGSPIVLNWGKLARLPKPIRDAARGYVHSLIPEWAPPSIGGLFYMYRLLAKCPYFYSQFDGTVSFRAFEELRADERAGGPELTRYRNWYEWAATMELAGFDRNVSNLLSTVTIGANPQGRPARKKDPKQGPLTDWERRDLLHKTLEASDDELPLIQRVAILLSMGLGSNSGPLSLLQIQDYEVKSSGGTTYHLLRVPRHKKGFSKERAEFRTRQIDSAWAPYVEQLIEQNRSAADKIYKRATGRPRPDNVTIPIFMRNQLRRDLTPAMAEYALHLTPLEYTLLLRRASERLEVRARDGGPLHLNARRLRSTFATNLIADGKSRQVVADALDHSSTRSIAHYEFEDFRLVASLDASVGDAMQVIVGAFLGTLTEKSSEAARDRLPSSRIHFFDQQQDQAEDLGNCGSNKSCDLIAPFACYGCRDFEPWIGAPHQRLLEDLKNERDRRQASAMHPRIVAVQDRLIQAVSEVVETIETTNTKLAETK
jgi:integrase